MKPAAGICNRARGVFIPLTAMIVLVILSVVGILFYLLSSGVVSENVRGVARLAALGALQAYSGKDCQDPNSINACHDLKFQAAKARAQQIIAAHGTLAGVSTDNAGESTNYAKLESGRYFYEKPSDGTDPCGDLTYPCFVSRATGEYANSMRLSGKVDNAFTRLMTVFVKPGTVSTETEFKVTATTAPMRGCFLVDLSLSTAEDTHVPRLTDDQDPPPSSASFHYNLSYADPGPSSDVAPDEANVPAYWPGLPDSRPGGSEIESTRHFKDDYVTVQSLPQDANSWSSYNKKAVHPEPVNGTAVQQREANGVWYRLDAYRDDNYKGPKPWIDIMRGLQQTVSLFRQRAVPGDKICLVFYDDTLSWGRVVNLTSDWDYIAGPEASGRGGLIDTVSMTSSTLKQDLTSGAALPLWVQMRLFPRDDTNTDSILAMAYAISQLSQKSAVPSVDFIANFSDGLTDCYTDGTGSVTCNNDYDHYYNSMLKLKDMTETELVPEKIMLHMFQVGRQVAPNTLKLKSDSGNGCMSDEEARSTDRGVPYVMEQDWVNNCYAGSLLCRQAAYRDMYNVPFYQAGADWYQLVRMTGGRWVALRPPPSGYDENTCPAQDCSMSPGSPNSNAGASQGVYEDPKCRDVEAQVQDAMRAVFTDSKAFTLVRSN